MNREADKHLEATRAGMERARLAGKHIGRPPKGHPTLGPLSAVSRPESAEREPRAHGENLAPRTATGVVDKGPSSIGAQNKPTASPVEPAMDHGPATMDQGPAAGYSVNLPAYSTPANKAAAREAIGERLRKAAARLQDRAAEALAELADYHHESPYAPATEKVEAFYKAARRSYSLQVALHGRGLLAKRPAFDFGAEVKGLGLWHSTLGPSAAKPAVPMDKQAEALLAEWDSLR